ncbi:MAG: hypothetical protein AB3N16_01570 [Flavobacteriaceae bacterium]
MIRTDMKYTLHNTINKPLEVVAEKFGDPESIQYWMEGLQRVEHVSGTPGHAGAKRNLHSQYGNKEIIVLETLLEQHLPHQIKFAYESSMGRNEV